MKGRNLINMSDGCTYVVCVNILISLCLLHCNSQTTECTRDPALCGENSMCGNGGICSCNMGFMSPSGSQSDCINLRVENPNCTADCAYCPRIINCLSCISQYALLINESGAESCVAHCPDGYSLEAGTRMDVSFAIAMCIRQGNGGDNSSSGVSGVYIGIIIGVSVIVILIIIAMVIYCVCVINIGRVRQTFDITVEIATNEMNAHQNDAFLDNEQAEMENDNDDYLALADGDSEKAQFLQKLAKLRKQSSVFLRMLNDMRRRLKELPPDATAAKSYKNVMQDVTRLLYLLNKKPHNVQMPPDGMQLLNWSEEILRRYLQSQQQKRTSFARISTYGQQAETHF